MNPEIENESQNLELSNKTRCPDYDEDCLKMNTAHAVWCYLGCQNHPCGCEDLPIALGFCPIIHTNN